jgi:nicotinate phosphoribosyltransferase
MIPSGHPGGPGLLATDFYQLTMLDAYRQSGMAQRAVFEFFCRRLPHGRGFLLAAGLAPLLERLEGARFSEEEIAWLRACGRFSAEAVESFAAWRFTGDIDAVPEGTPVFADEPIVRIEAPIAEAQLVETLVISHLHYQTLIASKAARMVLAAPDAALIEYGLRRAHSLEAGLHAARAAYLAGFAGTATVAAGMRFGIPVSGTMAHSFIQAHDSEEEAFRHFAEARPSDVVLLIDTYDTEAAARTVARLGPELRARGIGLRGVRIDSGDLAVHAGRVRAILDEAGLCDVRIVASGGIDEWALRDFARRSAPIDMFGIGTSLATSQDQPAIDCAYKLVAYAGRPRRKRSEGKLLWPGAKQLFRRYAPDGTIARDVLALKDEAIEGEPLLRPVMRAGRRLPEPALERSRELAREQLARLPAALRELDCAEPPRPDISSGLLGLVAEMSAAGR